MAFIDSPDSSEFPVCVIFEKEILLKDDGTFPSFKDALKFRSLDEKSDFFEEKSFSLCILGLSEKIDAGKSFRYEGLREFFAENNEEKAFLPFRAKALCEWRKNFRFCSACGSKLENDAELSAKKCPECKKIFFPRTDPCIIVVVHKDGKILLAKHVQRNQEIYACIAGFMEAGESAEMAVRREIFEETGLSVKNIKYRGSQSWPFPQQLMLGFTADYESGEIKLQKEELSDAQWFDPENCPLSPKPGSIAYRLIHKLY